MTDSELHVLGDTGMGVGGDEWLNNGSGASKIFNWEKRNGISLKTTVLKQQALKLCISSFKAVCILATH